MQTRLSPLIVVALLAFLGGAEKADLAKLQGEWQMVSSSRDGSELPAESVKLGKRVCKDDETTVHVGDMLIMTAKFKLDASKTPKQIDYDVKAGPFAGKHQLGIYKFENDQVTSCFAPPDKPRPDDFKSEKGDGRTLSVWKKAGEHGH